MHGPDELWLYHRDLEDVTKRCVLRNSNDKQGKAKFRRIKEHLHQKTKEQRVLNHKEIQKKKQWSKCFPTKFTFIRTDSPKLLLLACVALHLTTFCTAQSINEKDGTVTKDYDKNHNAALVNSENEEVLANEPPHSTSHHAKEDFHLRKNQGRNYYHDSTTSSKDEENSSSSLFPFPIYYAAYIANAVESGVREANNLYETVEPDLYKKGKLRRAFHMQHFYDNFIPICFRIIE